MGIILFILILAVLVLVHELGHFFAAKKSGVLVEEFGFGFPPRLFGIKIGETLYSINLIPLGGFVKLFGEEYHEDKKTSASLKSRAFIYKKPWQKVVIIVAGIAGNFVLGWFIISFLFTQGVPTPVGKVFVEQVQKNSPAQAAGLQAKDQILKLEINGKEYVIKASEDLIRISKENAGKTINVHINRNDVLRQVRLVPRKNPPPGQGPLGVVVTTPFVEKKYSWYEAPFYGLAFAFDATVKIVQGLSKIIVQFITFQKPDADIRGPIGIAQITGETIKFGKNAILELTALLSLNLAVINILPFPALDGGRLTFILYEWTTRKRVNKTVKRYVNLFGIVVLLTLALVISIYDILRLAK